MAKSILDEICDHTLARLPERKALVSDKQIEFEARNAAPPRDFLGALTAEGMSLIGELKQASPSKGVLREPFDTAALAKAYEVGGARALSVLTEPDYFKGAPERIAEAKAACSLPALRKDFILDPYQVYEARAIGADALLLIVRCLDDARLADLLALTHEVGLVALVETHDAAELERAQRCGARIIGVNNRNLDTFQVDLQTTFDLIGRLDPHHVLVSESGIHSADDIRRLAEAGVHAVLVGESIVTAADPTAKIRELLA
ncbi:MAG: indole-3-glycerol phosphate synthase TrpC [Deltaproteobacteria bacterium]|nr:indole-3-glycerol phosphate synthase TrpC [Deltaproteobacteria bacterium]